MIVNNKSSSLNIFIENNFLINLIPKYLYFYIQNTLYNKYIKNDFFFNKSFIIELFFFLKKNSLIKKNYLVDILCTDYINKNYRFQLSYYIGSLTSKNRIFFKTWLNANDYMFSLTNIYKSSNWYEREIWDLFGVYFIYHPDLRRILTDYGSEGFPLRKDYPLTGFFEIKYNFDKNKIIYKNVELQNKYKLLNIISPWNKNLI